MKRAISLLLTSAMILSLAGCSKTEESIKKKKKTKKTTTTEATDTEDTETETEVPTDTEPTETETDPTTSPAAPDTIRLTHDLDVLRFTNDYTRNDYAEMPDKFTDQMFWVCSACDQYHLDSPGYDALSGVLDNLAMEMKADSDRYYEQFLGQFDSYIEDATEDNVWNYTDHYRYNSLRIMRADEKVMSFYRSVVTRYTDGYGDFNEYYNIDPKTGDPIELHDIVTDFAAFADAVEEYETTHFYAYTPYGLFTAMADHLRKGELDQLDFCLTQNCIILCMMYESPIDQEVSEYVCYFSALAHPDCVDPDYFTSTTGNYTLTPDSANAIYWDFDEDGTIDKFVIDYDENFTTGTPDTFNITASVNDIPYAVGDAGSDIEDCYDLGNIYLMSINGEYLLYIEGYVDDPTDPYFIFKRNGNAFDYIGYCGQFSWYPYDPDNVGIQIRADMLGTGSFTKPSSLGAGGGLPETTDTYYKKTGVGISTEKMKLGLFNDNGQPTGNSITIPAGTPVRLEGIDAEKELAYFTTLHRDASQNESFQMVLTVDPDYEHYGVTFNGKGIFELFTGSNYYD